MKIQQAESSSQRGRVVHLDHPTETGQGAVSAPVEPRTKKSRTTAIRIRTTPAERAAIQAAGDRVGLGVSSFSRMAIVKAAGLKPAMPPRQKPDVYARALARWIAELARVGNNLNQCARALNSGNTAEVAELAGIRFELQNLREVVLSFDPGAE